jgi:hypothetical protein
MARTAALVGGAALAAPLALAQSAPPADLKGRVGQQDEPCICTEDKTTCLCCETVITPPFIACDLVVNGEEVTGPVAVDLNLTIDGRGKVEVKRFQVRK